MSHAQVTPGSTGRRPRLYTLPQLTAIAAKGIGRGLDFKSQYSAVWDVSGGCEAPVSLNLDGRSHRLEGASYVRAPGHIFGLTLFAPCRKCRVCLKRRMIRWAKAGTLEIVQSARTWFGTITLSPHNHALLRMATSKRLRSGGTDYDSLSAEHKFAETMREYGYEVTKWLKRVRKNTGAPLRYMLTAEPHKSGLIHFHVLVHEIDSARPVRHAQLSSSWKLGFTKFKLVNCRENVDRSAWYVAKYLSKSNTSRVRASLGYGRLREPEQNPSQTIAWPVGPSVTPPAPPFTQQEEVNGRQDSDADGANSASPPQRPAPGEKQTQPPLPREEPPLAPSEIARRWPGATVEPPQAGAFFNSGLRRAASAISARLARGRRAQSEALWEGASERAPVDASG